MDFTTPLTVNQAFNGAADRIAFFNASNVPSTDVDLKFFSATNSVCVNGATALGGLNVKANTLGSFIYVNDTTHYGANTLNFGGAYSFAFTECNVRCRFEEAQSQDVASPVSNNLTLPSGQFTSGNMIVVTGTNTIKTMVSTGWQDGSIVQLHLLDGLTITHADATGTATNLKIHTIGSVNKVCLANTQIKFRISTVNSVRAWRQVDLESIVI